MLRSCFPGSGLTSVWQWEVVNVFFLLPLCLQLLPSLLICHYFHSQDILPSFYFLPSCGRAVKQRLCGCLALVWGQSPPQSPFCTLTPSMGFGDTNSAQQIDLRFCMPANVYFYLQITLYKINLELVWLLQDKTPDLKSKTRNLELLT